MGASPARDVTILLSQWQSGDRAALDQLLPVVYHELQRLAAGYIRGERTGHTLQATALVHEAYLRLVNQKTPDYRNRAHFFGVAAQVMRQVLVDFSRSRNAAKRGRGERINIDDVVAASAERPRELLDLDEALTELAKIDERKCKVIEMRYFGGLSNEEIADVLEISVPTIVRDVRFAEAWLRQRLDASGE